MMIWPFGTPLLFSYVFWKHRDKIRRQNLLFSYRDKIGIPQPRRRNALIGPLVKGRGLRTEQMNHTDNKKEQSLASRLADTAKNKVVASAIKKTEDLAADGAQGLSYDTGSAGQAGELGTDGSPDALAPGLKDFFVESKDRDLPAYVVALISMYESDLPYWEVIECVRKLLLIGVLIFYEQGELEQLVLGLFIAVSSIMFYNWLKPYEDTLNDALQSACQFSIFVVLLSALILKFDEEDRASTTITFFLFCCALVPPIIAAGMSIIELCRDSEEELVLSATGLRKAASDILHRSPMLCRMMGAAAAKKNRVSATDKSPGSRDECDKPSTTSVTNLPGIAEDKPREQSASEAPNSFHATASKTESEAKGDLIC